MSTLYCTYDGSRAGTPLVWCKKNRTRRILKPTQQANLPLAQGLDPPLMRSLKTFYFEKINLGPVYMELPGRANFSYVSFKNASKRLHARQASPPTRGTLTTCPWHQARRGSFCHVNGSSRAISANRGEVNRENMVARSEYFRSYHLPVLSAEQNDSQPG